MRKWQFLLASIATVGLPVVVGSTPAWPASSVVLVNNTTQGYYNNHLGTILDGSQPQFPCCGDPLLDPAPEPDLSSVSSILGGWLSESPVPLNGNWSGPQAIPGTWALYTETAIIYEIDGGANGIRNVVAKIGVDNGIYLWENGVYRFGALAPGGAPIGEYVVHLGDVPPGKTFVQILREDHGGGTGYNIEMTGEPNSPPDCSGVVPDAARLWPPDHTLRPVVLTGASDPDGDPVTVTITAVSQDERVNGTSDGDTSPDAVLGPASNQVQLRSERSGTGDGRIYRIGFTASDGLASCSGVAIVGVPHDARPGSAVVDSGGTFDSLSG